MNTEQKIAAYFKKHGDRKEILTKLDKIMISCGLTADYKWSLPVYTHDGKNICGLGATKKYAGIWFFQGGLLKDEAGVLVNAQEGKTKAMRQWRFTSASDVKTRLVKKYIRESLANFRAGKTIKPTQRKPLVIPSLMKETFESDKKLRVAFERLSLSKKRDFAEYIDTAKQETTKLRRLKKITPMILSGIGLNDKYSKNRK